MKIEMTPIDTRLIFRVNEKRGTAGDESAEYISFLRYLATTFLPFSTYRMMFIGSENDDALFAIEFEKVSFKILCEYRNEWPVQESDNYSLFE